MARDNERTARQIGGERLVRFFDLVQERQRLRWNCPDWRDAPIIDADLTNWRDVSHALNQLMRHDPDPPVAGIASGQPGEAD